MSNARADAIYDYHTASDTEYNEAVADNAKWVGRFLGLGTGAIPPPFSVVTEPVNWLVEDVTESVVKSVEQDTTEEAERDAGNQYSDGREAVASASSLAVTTFFEQHREFDQKTMDAINRAARTAAGVSHSDGAQWNSSGDGT